MTVEREQLEQELYTDILEALIGDLKPSTVDEGTFVEEVAKIAFKASLSHVEQLQEGYLNLHAKVRELSRVDTGTSIS